MARRKTTFLPEARTEDLVFQEIDNETLVYDLRSHKAHCLNSTARLVFGMCDGRTTVVEIAQSLTGQLGTTVGDEVVWLALGRLGRANLLQRQGAEIIQMNAPRREAIRRLGVGAALALPLVASMVSPVAAQLAVSHCIPNNGTCTAGQPGVCCNMTAGNPNVACPGNGMC